MDTNDVGKKFFIMTTEGWMYVQCTKHEVDHRVVESIDGGDSITAEIYHLDWVDHVLCGQIKKANEVMV
jgi:hypothetical protein